ncbi:MAG: cupin domain-containing protein [Alphaproteobacteria bacterium]|nr:cupin domain-containing protein [Alphaproteobacteria bacterium]
MLTANFDARQVIQVEVGDFHFVPGQVAPVHTHTAPAVGYVAKGMIIYQVEGEKPQILREGDAFYEPTGQRILRFDNASATEEAIFIDFNLEQVGEPFIVFEAKPTQAIDRRPLPTIKLDGKGVDRVDVYTSEIAKSGSLKLENQLPTLGYVAEGVIELRTKGKPAQRLVAGSSFALPTADAQATIVNASNEVAAKVVTFRLSRALRS